MGSESSEVDKTEPLALRQEQRKFIKQAIDSSFMKAGLKISNNGSHASFSTAINDSVFKYSLCIQGLTDDTLEKKATTFSLPNQDNSRKAVPISYGHDALGAARSSQVKSVIPISMEEVEVPFAIEDKPVPASSLEVPEEPSTTSHAVEMDACSGGARNSSNSHFWSGRKLRSAAFMLNLFNLQRLSWGSSANDQEKVELPVRELESLRSELAYLEERESYLKAQLEHVDEVLRSARFSVLTAIFCAPSSNRFFPPVLRPLQRWTALPGEPPPLDDADVDDWLPRFVVLNGPCIFFYLLSTDFSPQDSTLLADIVEVGSLPSFTREHDETWYSAYILTRQGLRYECSSVSEVQVDSWLKVLQTDIKLVSETKVPSWFQ
ncbi:hypothetical protein NC653_001047 [Populus alba x Populus x berolinensis]|uniref:PH domain-containing protein n=1 Tax=Populus alba x Populus x berolinensis TaxID=444605 RepID=A0AAD6RLU6_9ROSI|nr:hypothetical protein NC653_001047 [Populus alba x Populus x berolinensis]